MLVYVDLEHDRLQNEPELWEKSLARRLKHKYQLEELSGEPCLIVRYYNLNLALLRELAPPVRAVIVSGCYTDFEHYSEESLAGLRAVYREAAWPTLGLCGGHQLLAQTYGADIGPLGPLASGEPDPYAEAYVPGMKQERGFMPVNLRRPHPLFADLAHQPTFFQSHYWEVKAPPPGFYILAESDMCGVQFHPEEYNEAHLDGRKVLENFLKMVGSQ